METDVTKAQSIRVFCVDDHPVVRNGLRVLIDSQPDMSMVGEAGRAEEAAISLPQLKPDVMLLDLRLPGIHGSEAISYMRRAEPEVKIIVLSTFGGDVEVRRCLGAGALAYVLKDADTDELLNAVRKVRAGKPHISPSLTGSQVNASLDLTERETEILQLMANGSRNKEIAFQLGLQIDTVKWYAKSIYTKLSVRDRTEAVTIAVRRGIICL